MNLCGADRGKGKPCQAQAGKGTTHLGYGQCKNHGGSTPAGEVYGTRLMLLSEARKWATDHEGDPGELMLAAVRASAAHAMLVERHVLGLTPQDKAYLEWCRALGVLQKNAADTAARAISLNLEERRTRQIERQAGAISSALEAYIGYIAEQLGDAVTEHHEGGLARAFARLESYEGTAVEEPLELAA